MKQKTMKKGIWYAGIGVAVVFAAVLIVVVYRRENQFQPVGSDRDLQVNQVVFSEDDASAYGGDRQQNSEDEIWKKDEEAQDQNRPDRNGQADYLFEENELARAGADSLLMPEEGGSENVPFSDQGMEDLLHGNGSGYVLTADADQADWIISGPGVPGIGEGNFISSGNAREEEGSSSGNRNNISEVAGNIESSSNNTGNGMTAATPGQGNSSPASPAASPSTTPEPAPSQRPSDRVPNPDFGKNDPDIDFTVNKKFNEDIIGGNSEENADGFDVHIAKGSGWTFLYKGQQIDKKTIYCALDTYVQKIDWDSSYPGLVNYCWGIEDLDKYVRIDEVSIDGGREWISDFPIIIPEDIPDSTMRIRVSYRLSKEAAWTQQEVEYEVESNCIYVLSKKLSVENPVVNKEDILNNTMFTKMHTQEGEILNLYYVQNDLLSPSKNMDQSLPYVFSGWTEDGEPVPWFYSADKGRHILEPGDLVPVGDGYRIELKSQWVTDDYQVSPLSANNLCYLQTLTSFHEDSMDIFQRMMSWKKTTSVLAEYKLTVPAYVQAVDIDQEADRYVDYLELPASVIYVNNIDDGLMVYNGYIVSPENRNYKATENGILVNREETAILGIPFKVENLEIPVSAEQVNLPEKNQIKTLTLLTEDMANFPQINYENLPEECQILVADSVLEEFLTENYEMYFKDTQCKVSTIEDPLVSYKIKNDLMIDSNGQLCKVLDEEAEQILMPKEITGFAENVFAENHLITKLILSENQKLTLTENCFTNSNLEMISCATKEQYDSILEQLGKIKTGAKNDLQVVLLQNASGYVFEEETTDGGTEITLISAPEDLVSFEGIIQTKDGIEIVPTKIGDKAFAGNNSLEWVILDKATDTIGDQAFKNCTSLQGLLIDARDTVTIGDKALDGCGSLRFVASNAKKAIRKNDYDLILKDSGNNPLFFVPINAEGYTSNCVEFVEGTDLPEYQIVSIGKNSRMLYGISADGSPWLAIRSGTKMDETVTLPDTTIEIFRYAMEGTCAQDGASYEITNLGNLKDLYIDKNAFSNSEIGNELSLNGVIDLGCYAFQNCMNLTKVTLPGIEELGAEAFTGCDNLQSIVLNGDKLETFVLVDWGVPFKFNGSWMAEDEAARIQITLSGMEKETFVKKQRYLFAGYSEDEFPAYLEMWNGVFNQLFWYGVDEAGVDQEVKAEVLTAENRLRGILHMESVSEPTDYYPYHYDSLNKIVTLVGVPSDKEEIDFTNLMIEDLPDDAKIDYIAADTFSGCQVKTVKFDENLKGIESGIFNGITGDLTVEFTGTDPVELRNWTSDNPFSFGIEDEKLHLVIAEENREAYLEAWSDAIGEERLRKMMGLDSLEESILSEDLQEVSDQEEQEKENQKKEDPETDETEETDPSLDEEESGDTKNPEDSKDSNDADDSDDTSDPDSSKDTDDSSKPDGSEDSGNTGDSSKPDDGKEPDSTKDPDNLKENEDSEDSENKDSQNSSGNDTKVEDAVL